MPKIKVNEHKIEYVDHVRDMGYELNRTITGNNHTSKIQQNDKPSQENTANEYQITIVQDVSTPNIWHIHNYGIHGTRGYDTKMERMQNICIRYISNINRFEHITPHRKELGLLKLFDR